MMAAPRNSLCACRSRSGVLATFLVLAAIGVCGCRTGARRSAELLETRIRNQEETIASLRRRMSTLEADRQVARREADTLRASIEKPDEAVLLTEHVETQFRIAAISINTFLSGGLDRDAIHGDELLTVLVVPADEAGDTLRASGTLEIDVVDFSAPAGQQQIGHWKFDRDKTRDLWHFGLIGRGIQVTVPWQRVPVSESITVHARLTLPDGREFNATEKLRVQPPASNVPDSTEVPDTVPTSTDIQPAPATEAGLQPPLMPNYETRRFAGLTGTGWQSTAR